MIKFFRKIRQKLIEQQKVRSYLLYAIGEIILVVIGILIALSINNWNEQRKEQNRLLNIYSLIYADIENDKQDLKRNFEFYNKMKPVFEKVLKDSITPDLLDQGLSRLMGGGPTIILNKTGVNQLKELQSKDSLPLKIINVYNVMETIMLTTENRITNEVTSHSLYLRDTYDWYPEWINNRIMKDVGSKDLHDYFLYNSVYRNRVVWIYQQIFNNYLPVLNDMIKNITELQNELTIILKKPQ